MVLYRREFTFVLQNGIKFRFSFDDTQTHHPETRKPAFRWLGMTRKAENGNKIENIFNECKKRIFGRDISNTIVKRSKVVSQFDGEFNGITTIPTKFDVKAELLKDEVKRSNSDQNSNYHFGPFVPINTPK